MIGWFGNFLFKMKSITLGLTSLFITTFISIFFIGYTKTNYDVGYGDFYVFFSIHQLIDAGYSLYKDIWDHKDLGFYLFNQFFYKIFGPKGLFISTLFIIIIFYFSFLYYLKKNLILKNYYSVAVLSVFFIVSIDSFIATHGETQAPLIILSGIFLYNFNKYLSFFLFILALSIKVSGLPIIILFFIFKFLQYKSKKNFLFRELLPLVIFTSLLISLFLFIIILFEKSYLLAGWGEITHFNKMYAENIRGNNLFSLNSRDLVIDIARIFFYFTKDTAIFFVLSVFSLLINLIFFKSLTQDELNFFLVNTYLYILLIFSALCVMYLHIPVTFHHYQFLNPFLITYFLINLAVLINKIKYNNLIYILIIISLFFKSNILDNKNNFFNFIDPINSNGELSYEISNIENYSFILLGGNHVKLDYSSLKKNKLNMSCRFFYQLEHIIDVYYAEMIDCINEKPDIIFLFKDEALLKIFYGKYFEEIMKLMNQFTEQEYRVCGDNDYFLIYSKNSNYCKRIE